MMSNDNVLKVLNELTDILDLSDEFTYRELYEQARTYIFNKRMEVQDITIVTGNDPKDNKMSEAELYEQAKEAFYAWDDKCAIEWGGYGEWGSGLGDEQRHMWCEGYVQAMLTMEKSK